MDIITSGQLRNALAEYQKITSRPDGKDSEEAKQFHSQQQSILGDYASGKIDREPAAVKQLLDYISVFATNGKTMTAEGMLAYRLFIASILKQYNDLYETAVDGEKPDDGQEPDRYEQIAEEFDWSTELYAGGIAPRQSISQYKESSDINKRWYALSRVAAACEKVADLTINWATTATYLISTEKMGKDKIEKEISLFEQELFEKIKKEEGEAKAKEYRKTIQKLVKDRLGNDGARIENEYKNNSANIDRQARKDMSDSVQAVDTIRKKVLQVSINYCIDRLKEPGLPLEEEQNILRMRISLKGQLKTLEKQLGKADKGQIYRPWAKQK